MKIGKKSRHGRKRNPVPHKPHGSTHGVVVDPISRAMKRIQRENLERARKPRFGDEEDRAA